MADILCLDSEPDTIAALKNAGHNVLAALFGYRDGRRHLHRAPQDFDFIVCDLRRPACFDVTRWGPYGGNDNFKCAIIPEDQVGWNSRLISRGHAGATNREYLHRLIYESQVKRMNEPSPFGPGDVLQAIAMGGVPALLFLNPEWMLRTGGHEFPAFVGLQWETGETNVAKFKILEPLAGFAAEWQPPLSIISPIRCLLRSGPSAPLRTNVDFALESTVIVSDRVGATLGAFIRCGAGAIWLLPQTANNAAVALAFVESMYSNL